MSRKTTGSTVPRSHAMASKSNAQAERFEIDAFDQFIEEQLKKQRSSEDHSADEIVCHVY
jgi:hypothetical protein